MEHALDLSGGTRSNYPCRLHIYRIPLALLLLLNPAGVSPFRTWVPCAFTLQFSLCESIMSALRRRNREGHGQHPLQSLCDERDHSHEVVEDVDRSRLLFYPGES